MRILVTGGAGFIGSRLHTVLLDAGHHVLVIDDLRVPHPKPLPSESLEVVIETLGTGAAARAIRNFGPEVVYHLAAVHYVPYTEANPEETRRVNVDDSAWLVDLCDDLSLRAFVACSSAAVYGFSDSALTEESPFDPRGVYGETKIALEGMLRRYSAANPAVTVGCARLFNVYGPGNLTPHVMPTLMEQIWRQDLIRVGNTWPKRDYVHVNDVASALVRLSEGPTGFAAYNVGTGVGTSVAELIGMLAAAAGLPGRYEVDPERERADDGHLISDPSRIITRTGWRPRVELSDGVAWLAEDSVAASGPSR